jgi:hypothetical protein
MLPSYTGGMSQKQKSSVRHTRAVRVAQSKHVPAPPPAPAVEVRLTELIHPAAYAQMDLVHRLGLRNRLLTLPVMVALVVSMIWRQIGSACELVRVLEREGFLWITPLQVTQQALSDRLLNFPAVLFERVCLEIFPVLHARWRERTRPIPPEVLYARGHFDRLLIFDGSTLDVLLRKLKALRDLPIAPLAGRMGALLDLASRLPVALWYEPDARAHDHRFVDRLLTALHSRDLLIFDSGLLDFDWFAQLTLRCVAFITRPHTNLVYRAVEVLQQTVFVRDQIVEVGSATTGQRLRLVEVVYQGHGYRYLTNVLDPSVLPADLVAALYRRRWRIEEAFLVVKRLLGFAYLWVGAENGIQLQLWATWLLYAILIDLTDAVAQELDVVFDALSVEMVFRGLYHFTMAYHRGETEEVVSYLAQQARRLAILKRPRKSHQLLPAASP